MKPNLVYKGRRKDNGEMVFGKYVVIKPEGNRYLRHYIVPTNLTSDSTKAEVYAETVEKS